MSIFRQFLASWRLAREVAKHRICPACLQPFSGPGFRIAGQVWCAETCCPAVYREVYAKVQRARESGL